MNWLTIFIKLD